MSKHAEGFDQSNKTRRGPHLSFANLPFREGFDVVSRPSIEMDRALDPCDDLGWKIEAIVPLQLDERESFRNGQMRRNIYAETRHPSYDPASFLLDAWVPSSIWNPTVPCRNSRGRHRIAQSTVLRIRFPIPKESYHPVQSLFHRNHEERENKKGWDATNPRRSILVPCVEEGGRFDPTRPCLHLSHLLFDRPSIFTPVFHSHSSKGLDLLPSTRKTR